VEQFSANSVNGTNRTSLAYTQKLLSDELLDASGLKGQDLLKVAHLETPVFYTIKIQFIQFKFSFFSFWASQCTVVFTKFKMSAEGFLKTFYLLKNQTR
jgi:hypothetical protein